MQRWATLSLLLFAAGGCVPDPNDRTGGGEPGSPGSPGAPGNNDSPDLSYGAVVPPGNPACNQTNPPQNGDQDGDGYTPAQGDCDDCDPLINPGAIQIAGDPIDYACNGKPGVVPECDGAVSGLRDATSLAKAFEQCDPRFFTSAVLVGPSDSRARKVVPHFGILKTRAGTTMTLLSNGIAADKNDPDFDPVNEEDPGTDLDDNNTYTNPLPNLAGAAGCSQDQPDTVNDYTELVVHLVAPTNAKSFSFDFQFFSAEYPQYVCTEYNDEFLVLQESKNEFGTPTNIAFDMHKNPVTINSGFFTVCTNDTTKPQTQHCTKPVSNIDGTGFEDPPDGNLLGGLGGLLGDADIPGGSTGWLTTTSPVTPREEVVLHFIIFDEGDHVLDSAVLIDNFRWAATATTAPATTPIM